MKQLLNSSFVIICMFSLVLLGVFNTCQTNNLEALVIENQKTIKRLAKTGLQLKVAGQGHNRHRNAGIDQTKAGLADKSNLLKAMGRPMVKADKIVPKGTLRLIWKSDPRGMNPYIANGADVAALSSWTMNRLAGSRPDDPAHRTPALAVKITTPDDGLTYDITLRKGVYWHLPQVDWDGGKYDWLKGKGPNGRHELRADDFIFVFEMIRNPQVAGRISSMRNYFDALDTFEAKGPYQLRVKFKEKLYMNKYTLMDLQPMPRWLYMFDEDGTKFSAETWGLKLNEHWFNQKSVGTGPYKFVSWEKGRFIKLERDDTYWGSPGTFEQIKIEMVKDTSGWPRYLKTDRADLISLRPPQYRQLILKNKGPIMGKKEIKKTMRSSLGYAYFGWNHDSKFFSDKRVRQAMTLALNRTGMIDKIFLGLGKLTTGPFAHQNPCYDKSVKPYPFDLKKAGKKLDEAGWKDTDGDGIRDKVIDGVKTAFEFRMLVWQSKTWKSVTSDVFREDLLSIGVKLRIEQLEWSMMLKRMDERDFDGYTGAWALGWHTDFMQIWHSREADKSKSSNRIGFRNKEADRIAETLRKTFDNDERTKLCHQFHALVHEEQPYTFIMQSETPIIYWEHLNKPEFALSYPYSNFLHWAFRSERP